MSWQEGARFEADFEVTERVYEGFLATFNDRNPLHVDEAYARARGFRGRVMHGNLLGGMLSYFVGECLPVREVMLQRQELRFRKPVYLGDRLKLVATLTHVSEAVGALEFGVAFSNEAGETVATGKLGVGLL